MTSPRRTRLAGGAMLLVLALAGCHQKLMPTPVCFQDSGVDPLAETPMDLRKPTSRVLIVTNREPTGRSDPANYFGKERSDELRLAIAEIEMGPNMTWEQLREQSLREKRSRKPTVRLTGLEELGPLWHEIPPLRSAGSENDEVVQRLFEEVTNALDDSHRDDVFILVHGFNTTLPNNAGVAAELHYYLGEEGLFVSFEWPSRGSMFAYSKDKANAAYSTRYLRLFLQFLAERTTVKRIHLIGHSAGAPPTVGAIRELRLMHFDDDPETIRKKYRIEHVVLVAPDMDLQQFINASHDGVYEVPRKLVIYISTHDKALNISSWIYGFARLGEPLEALTPKDLDNLRHHPNVQVIDVATAEKKHGSFLGHSYFHDDPWVSADLIMLLRHGVEPEARGLTRTEDSPIWQFPEDYPERSRAAARRAYGVEE